jgi:hypothetical protein
MKFDLGQVVVTPGAQEALSNWGENVDALLSRHQTGDWGDVSEEIRKVNEEGVAGQRNLVSIYTTPSGTAITVFTKADRSMTLVHLGPM